ncbi:hypothetical protein MY4824_009088 [Beauveria thailandica]
MKVSTIGSFLVAVATGAAAENTDEYEYVVIGSGPGGGSVAANLARSGHSVFLIEAGEDAGDNRIEQVPAWFNIAGEAPGISWHFFVNHFQNETQAKRDDKYTYRLNNGSYYVGLDPPTDAEPLGIYYPRGGTVGGSSEANAMYFVAPPDNDWKYIAELTKDDSWTAESMRKYFVEVERNGYLPPDAPGHGSDGYVSSHQVNDTYVTTRPGITKLVEEAIRELEGIDVDSEEQLVELLRRDLNRIDTNRYENSSALNVVLHIDSRRRRNGAREHVVDTFNARDEGGSPKYPLTLSTQSLATRVLFHNTTGSQKPRAYGVEYLVGEALYSGDDRYNASNTGERKTVTASREVIVAGGAFNTPQILKLSGIGPRAELEELDIPVVVDLPAVGAYLQDNYEGGVRVRASSSWENNPFENCKMDPTLSPSEDPCLQLWETQGLGPYGEGGAPLFMLFRSSVSENEDCDIGLFGSPNADFRGFFPGYSTVTAPDNAFFWSVVKMQPLNKAGTVALRSTNPRDTPLINFNWFEQNEERELQAMAEGTEMAMRVFNATGAPYAPFDVLEPNPGVDVRQSIKDNAFSHHATSTCRMGPKDHPDYCVDSNFKVNGVDGLRVVDASIFPRTPGAFPVAPTFMVSQKAFHVILADAAEYDKTLRNGTGTGSGTGTGIGGSVVTGVAPTWQQPTAMFRVSVALAAAVLFFTF